MTLMTTVIGVLAMSVTIVITIVIILAAHAVKNDMIRRKEVLRKIKSAIYRTESKEAGKELWKLHEAVWMMGEEIENE